jgi:pimeloyl-ACP methyl ester carboxylesterase
MRRFVGISVLVFGLLLSACTVHKNAEASAVTASQIVSIRVGETLLDYRDLGGKGSPLLLLTGYAVTMEQWDPTFVSELALHHRVILLDNRGMGLSAAPEGPMSIEQMARDAAGLLDALAIRKADVLGWSMGGFIAQELALARPELVRSLVLCATAPDARQLMPLLVRMEAMTPGQFKAAQFPAAWARANADVIARLPQPFRPLDMTVVARQRAAIEHWHKETQRLRAVAARTLFLVGDEDWVCPQDDSLRMARVMPGSRLNVLGDAGHWMMYQYPEKLAFFVNDFLGGDAARAVAKHAAKDNVEVGD